jgi:hypothetical protein
MQGEGVRQKEAKMVSEYYGLLADLRKPDKADMGGVTIDMVKVRAAAIIEELEHYKHRFEKLAHAYAAGARFDFAAEFSLARVDWDHREMFKGQSFPIAESTEWDRRAP